MPSSVQQWRALEPELLVRVEWEADTTLFNRLTGETHLLTPLPAELLRLLEEASADEESLAEQLAARCDVACTPEWQEKVASMLRELEELELVEAPGS